MVNNKSPLQSLHRRKVMQAATFGAAVIAAPFIWTASRVTSKKIVIRDAGGIFTEIYKKAFYEPFTKATGIKIVSVSSLAEPIAQIRTMVESKRYLWDMAAISRFSILSLTADTPYLEPHEFKNDPVISSIPPHFILPHGVGINIYSTVLAYRTDAFKERQPPQSWKDLWDVQNFPGRRSLRKHPFDTIEQALMAAGVNPNTVYPCNLEQAFQSLEKIKPHIAAWWTSGAQTEQMLKSGEIDLTSVWAARAQSIIDAGAPVAIAWDQHIYSCESWAILKGTPHAELCRQFIQFASHPKRQALLAPYAITPTQPDALKYIHPKHAKLLQISPDSLKRGLYNNGSYWLKHQAEVITRFDDWLLT